MGSRYVMSLHPIFIAALLTLLAMTSVVGAFAQDSPPEITQATGIQLDLAAMTLLPQELDPAFISNGDTLLDRNGLVDVSPDYPAREYRRHLRRADFIARYGATGAEFDENDEIPRSALSYVALYEDADGASRGLSLVSDEGLDVNAETTEPATVVGEEALFTVSTGTDPFNGSEYDLVDYSFRVDNLVAGVTFFIYDGEAPDEETLTELAEQQFDRIESVLDDGSPELFLSMLRLDAANDFILCTAYEGYRLIDERRPMEYQDTQETYEARGANWADTNVEAVYRTEAYLYPEGESDIARALTVIADVYQFPSDADAAGFADLGAERYAGGVSDAYADVELIESLPAFDGETSGMSYVHGRDGDVQAPGYVYWVQWESFVIRIQADFESGVSEEGMVALVEAQIDCLGSLGDECDPMALPEEIIG